MNLAVKADFSLSDFYLIEMISIIFPLFLNYSAARMMYSLDKSRQDEAILLATKLNGLDGINITVRVLVV